MYELMEEILQGESFAAVTSIDLHDHLLLICFISECQVQ